MTPTIIGPQESSFALASGNREAWRQVLGLSGPKNPNQVPDTLKDDIGKHNETDFQEVESLDDADDSDDEDSDDDDSLERTDDPGDFE